MVKLDPSGLKRTRTRTSTHLSGLHLSVGLYILHTYSYRLKTKNRATIYALHIRLLVFWRAFPTFGTTRAAGLLLRPQEDPHKRRRGFREVRNRCRTRPPRALRLSRTPGRKHTHRSKRAKEREKTNHTHSFIFGS